MTVTTYEMVIEGVCNKFTEVIEDFLTEKTKHIVAEGIREHLEREKEKAKKIYLRNTKILMKHYPEFEAHVRGAITCKRDLIDSEYYKDLEGKSLGDILISDLDEDVYIASIQRTKSRTQLLLNNIDAQLDQLKKLCMRKGIIHKYHALEDFYIKGYVQPIIAEKYQCHVPQVSIWCNEMLQILSRLLFGFDCLDDF